MKSLLSALSVTLLIGCASSTGGIDWGKLPPIEIVLPPPPPPSTGNNPPSPPAKAHATMAFQVVDDKSGAAVADAFVRFEDGVERQVNDDGYAAFEREIGTYSVAFLADDYESATKRYQLEGNRQFTVKLKSTKTPEPPPVVISPPIVEPPPVVVPPPAPPVASYTQCAPGTNAYMVSMECVETVASKSTFYTLCQLGSQRNCHYFVREVASALAAFDPRWGLVEKKAGENVDGYSEDVVAYLPPPFPLSARTWQWRGLDIVAKSGVVGAYYMYGELRPSVSCNDPSHPADWCNREDMLWAPVPK